jgi:hypothetical protein
MKSLFLLSLPVVKVFEADGNAAAEMLAKASRFRDLKTLENLLSSGLSPDLPDQYGRAPIYYAAANSNTRPPAPRRAQNSIQWSHGLE